MYIPRHFQPDEVAAQAFLASVISGHLVSNTSKGLLSTLLPVNYVAQSNSLVGHIARINEQWSAATEQEALFISTINEAYISPTWYASKDLHHKVVPTWDYMTLHAYGRLQIHDDVDWLRAQVSALTDRFEAGREKPWQLSEAPEDYVAGQLRAIVGVELHISRIEVAFKMSQNKKEADLDGVIAGLTADGKPDIAAKVRELGEKMSG
jgi:transcriptional regulator